MIAPRVQKRPSAKHVARRRRVPPFLAGLIFGLAIVGVVTAVFAGPGTLSRVTAATPFSIESIGSQIGLSDADFKEVLIRIIRWTLGILALVAVSFIIYGGVLWMTSRGDEKRILKAKKVIASAVIGLIIVLLSFAIVSFVARAILNSGDTGGPIDGGPPGCTDLNCLGAFEVRSITTSCANPPAFRDDVSRCSAVVITFNSPVDDGTVATAVAASGDNELTIEECTDAGCTALEPARAPVDSQTYDGAGPPSDVHSSWIVPPPGKSIGFYHDQALFPEPVAPATRTYYRLQIPKTLTDRSGNPLEYCRKNAFERIPGGGCLDQGNYFEWIFNVGTAVDTEAPRVTQTYPDSSYLDIVARDPDRAVPRVTTFSVRLSEAIDPATVANSIVLKEITEPADIGSGTGYGEVATIDPANYQVFPSGDNQGLEIRLFPGSAAPPRPPFMLKPFTWYEISVRDVMDLCRNRQDPNPYVWVFETNDVVPDVASVSPPNEFDRACPDVPIQIDFTVSMYDPEHGGCLVDPSSVDPNGGFVKEGRLSAPDGGRALQIVPGDEYRGAPDLPHEFCKHYSFQPNAALATNTTYQVGVNTRYLVNDRGETLNYGDLPLADPSPLREDWHFAVTEPGRCANPPHIDRLDPALGPKGQCFSVQGFGFTDTQTGGDELRFGANALPPMAGGWTDRNIVTTAPTTEPQGSYGVKVRVDHGGAIGVLESNTVNFSINSNDLSDGPCLVAINPNQGPWGTRVDLSGTRFGNFTAGQSRVHFTGSAQIDPDTTPIMPFPAGGWSDGFVNDASVVANSRDGRISVLRGSAESNSIAFDVLPPIPGRPSVANRWPSGCDETCTNADAGADFDMAMLPASLNTTTVELRRCTSDDCSSLDAVNLATGVTYSETPLGNPTTFRLTIGHAPLAADTPYRIILHGGATGVLSSVSQPLRDDILDYDAAAPPGFDSVSWTFRTRDDATACAVQSVTLEPTPSVTARISQPVDFLSAAYSGPDACGPGGQALSADWSWNVTGTAISLTTDDDDGNGLTDPVQTAVGSAATPGETVTATADSHNATSTMIVSPDPTFCNTTADCATNELGQACPGSACVNNRCTPVVNALDSGLTPPESGPPGQGVTVRGCWFGNYVPAQSAVFYHNNQEADIPPNPACGGAPGTWKNYEVIRLVPAGAADGPVRLRRDDGRTDATNAAPGPAIPDFDVTGGSPGPYLCAIQPPAERVGNAVTLHGDNLDADGGGRNVATDKVTFHNAVDVTAYGAWTDDSAGVTVPTGAVDGLVRATTSVAASNGIAFDVLGSGPGGDACTNQCTNDGDCTAAGEGCGGGCCSPQPRVTATNPIDTAANVCRNVVVSATIGAAPLNASTVNASTAQLVPVDCATGAPTGPAVPAGIEATDTSIRLTPDLLAANRCYRGTLRNGIRSARGVRLGQLNADLEGSDGIADAYVWQFRVGAEVCQVDSVSVDPSIHTFTRNVPPGNTRVFTARAFGRGYEVSPVPSVSDWTWGWSLTDGAPVSLQPPTNQRTVTVQAQANGQTQLVATATGTAGFSGTRAGSAAIRVLLCDNPWSLADSVTGTFHDSGGYVQSLTGVPLDEYNFSFTYCQGQNGTALLPDLSRYFIRGPSGNRLKEFLFTHPSGGSRDGIGVLVFANNEGLSPEEWLEREVPGEGSGGSATTVDGYPGYQLGSTTYVAARQLDSSALVCTEEVENGGFESWPLPPNWRDPDVSGVDPRQDTTERAPGSTGSSSVTMDARTEDRNQQYYLVQNVSTPIDRRAYRVSGWVRARRVREVPAATRNAAGLITQCNPLICPERDFLTTYDRYGSAPGLFAGKPVGFDSGWQRIEFYVSNTNYAVGLTLNCYAEPGWQVWCDDVSVQELSSGCLGQIKQNVFVLSYNSDAAESTRAIVSQLLSSWELNVNPNLTAQDRAAIARDTQRLGDLKKLKRALTALQSRGQSFPALGGGTFTPKVSTSRWNSWNDAFASALGITPPTDPLNQFDPPCTRSGAYQPDPNTCWSENNREFRCPQSSHVYGYRYERTTPGSNTYTLGANLEYTGPGSGVGPSVDLCQDQPRSQCACFNYTINGP